MHQQNGHHTSTSQFKSIFDSKPDPIHRKNYQERRTINNSSTKTRLQEQTYKQYCTDQLTDSFESVPQKSKGVNLHGDTKKLKTSRNGKNSILNILNSRRFALSALESDQHADVALMSSSKVKYFDKNILQDNNKNNNFSSLVKRNLGKERMSAGNRNSIFNENVNDTLDQLVYKEIHFIEESDNNYSSDFSDEFSLLSSVSTSKSQNLQFDYDPTNSKNSFGVCESVSKTKSIAFVESVNETNNNVSVAENMNDINSGHSNRLHNNHYAVSRVKCRAKDLLKLIDLTIGELMNVFELKPNDDYEFFMLHSSECKNRNQCHVQTNGDPLHKEVQTESVDIYYGAWTQQPPCENGEFCERIISNNCSYDLSSSNDLDHVSSKITLYELANELCLGINNLDAKINPAPKNTINTFPINKLNTPENSSSIIMNTNKRLSDSLSENLQLMLNIINEEKVTNVSYLFKKKNTTDTNDFDLNEDDFLEIFFNTTDIRFLAKHKSDHVDGESQSMKSENTSSSEKLIAFNENEKNKPQSFLFPWENYECIACECAPRKQSVILTIHRPVKLCQEPGKVKEPFNYSESAGEFICIWTVIGLKQLPDRLLYCPGLSETGLKGANLNCAIFSPDNDTSLVIAGLQDGSLCIWDLHNYSSEILNKSTNMSVFTDIYHQCILTDHMNSPDLPIILSPTYKTSIVENKVFTNKSKFRSPINCLTQQHNHFNPIISVKIADRDIQRCGGEADESPKDIDEFQLIALDEIGSISLWLVIMNKKCKIKDSIENLVGSQTDYCLSPGTGRLRLIRLLFIHSKSAKIDIPIYVEINNSKCQVESNDWDISNQLNNKIITTCLDVTKHGNFLVGCSNGQILHRGRSPNQTVYPKVFSRILCFAAVQSLASHPHEALHIFIAGYTDGKICLFKTNHSQPIREWYITSPLPLVSLSKTQCEEDMTESASKVASTSSCNHLFVSVRKLIWSNTRCSVFFSLDSNNQVILWDTANILNMPNYHLHSNNMKSSLVGNSLGNFNQNSDKTPLYQINDICLSTLPCSNYINQVSLSSSSQVLAQSHPPRSLIVFYSHKVSIYWINSRWTDESENEVTLLQRSLDSFMDIS
ncbi:hypothetical protein MN116_001145 [Schistosoma mekongi]|uniref:WD repeat-containing protein 60 n=1 Tax=Schistosoma mekongi TaxID=38744 RepID=A0AAE2DA59_SCHME|nr:hypothetical protein MN116_001145 [Schistosoma mekongi]